MDNNLYCVYMHKNKINGKIYIGSTRYGDDPEKRYGKNGKRYHGEFKADIDKYGWDNFYHCIIQNNLSLEEANELERLTIIAFNATDPKYGYNIHIAGNTNNKQSAQKISESVSESLRQLYADGYINPMQGKHHSKQTKQKMSKSSKNRVWVNDGCNTKFVKQDELQQYLSDGWTKGRLIAKK